MNIKLLIVVGLIALAGCDENPDQPKAKSYILPKELSHCTIHKIDGNGPYLYITHCPNSATGTQWNVQEGKVNKTYRTIVIDGVQYVEQN